VGAAEGCCVVGSSQSAVELLQVVCDGWGVVWEWQLRQWAVSSTYAQGSSSLHQLLVIVNMRKHLLVRSMCGASSCMCGMEPVLLAVHPLPFMWQTTHCRCCRSLTAACQMQQDSRGTAAMEQGLGVFKHASAMCAHVVEAAVPSLAISQWSELLRLAWGHRQRSVPVWGHRPCCTAGVGVLCGCPSHVLGQGSCGSGSSTATDEAQALVHAGGCCSWLCCCQDVQQPPGWCAACG
jgi:hypothetical protein